MGSPAKGVVNRSTWGFGMPMLIRMTEGRASLAGGSRYPLHYYTADRHIVAALVMDGMRQRRCWRNLISTR